MKGKSILVLLAIVVIVAALAVIIYSLRVPRVVEIKPSVVTVTKDNAGYMHLMVKKYNLRRGRYEHERDYLIKGVVYQVVQIGQAPPWYDTWMTSPYDPAHKARVDVDKDGELGEYEKEVGDFQLLKDMGVNTIRLYDPPGLNCIPDHYKVTDEEIELAKQSLRELYSEYGIMTIMGHSLGYNLDYTDKQVRDQIEEEVLEMVRAYKDEPWVLMWNLGNENNIQPGYTRGDFARDYYQNTVEHIAKAIKEIDPNHPISISNMGLAGVYDFDKYCPSVDIYGANMYQARNFSGLWNTAARIDRPAYLTEFGCDALDSRKKPREPNEELQAEFIKQQWLDIEANHNAEKGTSLGGIYFEWLDEWWKAPYDDAWTHTYQGGWDAPTFDAGTRQSGNEEWWGVCGQAENGKYSPVYRHLRKSYYTLKELWR